MPPFEKLYRSDLKPARTSAANSRLFPSRKEFWTPPSVDLAIICFCAGWDDELRRWIAKSLTQKRRSGASSAGESAHWKLGYWFVQSQRDLVLGGLEQNP